MNIICLIFGVLFCVTGGLFAAGKCHLYLKTWKKMSKEEKNKIKIQPLVLNIGTMIFICGMIFVISGIFPGFKNAAFVGTILLWMAAAVVDVYFISRSARYIK